jgi:hypothetical protein
VSQAALGEAELKERMLALELEGLRAKRDALQADAARVRDSLEAARARAHGLEEERALAVEAAKEAQVSEVRCGEVRCVL